MAKKTMSCVQKPVETVSRPRVERADLPCKMNASVLDRYRHRKAKLIKIDVV
jgi:hypothetical protein